MVSSSFLEPDIRLTEKFQEFLQDTGIKFSHRGRDSFCLDDLFVFPDLKVIRDSLEEIPSNIEGEKILDHDSRVLIFGDEQSGKSTLAKKLFLTAYSSGFLPLIIEGVNIKKSDISSEIPKLLSKVYSNLDTEEFFKSSNILCIIDDISTSKLNKRSKNKFLQNINSIFPRTILLADESFQFVAPDFQELDTYKKLQILPFGHVRRSELIRKWVELEVTEETDDQQFWTRIDELKLHVDSLIRRNVVPAKPFYILLLLQSFETITPQKLELTSYGHYYQYLIYEALLRAHVKHTDIDTYLNVLSELGQAILASPTESLDEESLDNFFRNYSRSFFLPVNQTIVIEDLIRSSILRRSENGLRFRYRYSFYFFAAKSLADSLHKGSEAKEKIQYLLKTLHLDRSSNIVLFLTHHSKDPWILDEILYSIMDIFPHEEAATLESRSLRFLQDFIEEIPEIVVENRDARQERLKADRKKDEIEQQENEEDEIDSDENDDLESLDGDGIDEEKELEEFIRKVNKAFRVVEVCGQILRNRFGSLERDALESIYEESLLVSLRFLNIVLKSSEFMKDEAIRKIQRMLESSPNKSDSDIMREAESFYMSLNYFAILGLLNKISFSLGSARGREIYLKVTEGQSTPASKLIQEIIELQFEKRLDFKKVERLHNDFHGNPICDRLLKHIILRHCYMHDIGFRDRQKLADKLGIPIHLQQSVLMASKKKHK